MFEQINSVDSAQQERQRHWQFSKTKEIGSVEKRLHLEQRRRAQFAPSFSQRHCLVK